MRHFPVPGCLHTQPNAAMRHFPVPGCLYTKLNLGISNTAMRHFPVLGCLYTKFNSGISNTPAGIFDVDSTSNEIFLRFSTLFRRQNFGRRIDVDISTVFIKTVV